jgi:hypothetical protein
MLDVGAEAETLALMWPRQASGGTSKAQASSITAESQRRVARQDAKRHG